MSDFNFTAALLAAQEPKTRQAAEDALNAFRDSNLPAFVVGLCTELGTEDKPEKARQLAGLMLKNLTVSKNEAEKKVLEARWLTIADGVRANIRAMLMHTLASPVKAVRSTAAVVIGKLSAVEVPQGKWPELVKSLVDNCCQLSNIPLRQASFEALGFICEEIPEHLQTSSNPILNAISTGMKPEETNIAIKQAAATALRNSLEFARANFAVAGERNLIMQMVFTAAACEDVSVREVAFQCLHEIAFLYYEHLPAYMQYIFDLTANALKKEQESVQLQAIEFWSTICDVEMDIAQEIKEAARTKAAARTSNNFALGVLPSLCPLLLEQLTHQSDTLDDDTMTPAMAAGAALGVLALCTGDAVVPHVLPFIQANVQSPDWRLRESATLAFGAILEGPTREKLGLLVKQAFSVLLAHLSDKNDLVKDTAAWTIGRVCHLLPETVGEEILPKLMQALLTGLGESPKVAANVCWAVHNLAQAVEPVGDSSPLSRYFEGMMHGLLTCTERSDTGEANLLGAAYEAVNSMIQSAAPDMYPLVGQMMPTLVKRLGTTLESGSSDPKVLEVQGLLCAALQCIIQRLSADVIGPAADMLMTLFLKVMSAKSATVMEEAMLAIGALANRTGESFEKYMAHFRPILVMGLTAVKEHHLCVVSVGVVGDISRALDSKLAPFCDELMTILLANLQNPEVERVVKPHIISCLGDIALAVGGFFDRYLPYVMNMLIQASKTTFDTGAFEDYEYLEKLRESILEAYTGILQGLGGDSKAELLLPHMTNIVPFLVMVSADENRTDDVTRSAVGVIGDMAVRLGKSVVEVLRLPAVYALVKSSMESENEATREAAKWVKESVEKVMA